MDTGEVRKDFPMLQKPEPSVYFDNACTTLKPQAVIDAMNGYYTGYSGCAGRSAHHVANKTNEEFELARHDIAKFVNAKETELIFTKNATEALNLVIQSVKPSKNKGDAVATIMEHHSAYVPLKRRKDLQVKLVMDPGSLEEWQEKITKKTRLVVVHGITNTTATSPPIKEVVKLAHDNGSLVLVDGAQSVAHSSTDFRGSGFDFLAFSGHKMLGPTGIGCLVAREEHIREFDPFLVGGGTIEQVKPDQVTYLEGPHKFEAGIQNYSGAIGLSAATAYLKKIGMKNVELHELKLLKEMEKRSGELEKTRFYGSFRGKKSAILLFNINGVEAHQVSIMLDKMGRICTRSGVFCAQPGMEHIGAGNGAARASLYIYNTKEELDIFFDAVSELEKTLGG